MRWTSVLLQALLASATSAHLDRFFAKRQTDCSNLDGLDICYDPSASIEDCKNYVCQNPCFTSVDFVAECCQNASAADFVNCIPSSVGNPQPDVPSGSLDVPAGSFYPYPSAPGIGPSSFFPTIGGAGGLSLGSVSPTLAPGPVQTSGVIGGSGGIIGPVPTTRPGSIVTPTGGATIQTGQQSGIIGASGASGSGLQQPGSTSRFSQMTSQIGGGPDPTRAPSSSSTGAAFLHAPPADWISVLAAMAFAALGA